MDMDKVKLEDAASKKMACIECRQHKVKCDSHLYYPDPCSRCKKRQLDCILQAGFRRTSKRQRLLKMEEEMAELKRSLESSELERRKIVSGSLLELSNPERTSQSSAANTPSAAPPPPAHQTLSERYVAPSSGGLPSPVFISGRPPNPQSIINTPGSVSSSVTSNTNGSAQFTVTGRVPTKTDIESLHCAPKSMDGYTLRSETIEELFMAFVTKYHPFLPVVDISKGPEKIYQLSPPLFWTIMSVASRRYEKDDKIMEKLSAIVKTCMADITISPVTRFAGGNKKTTATGEGGESNTSSASATPKNGLPSRGFNIASVYSVQAFLIFTLWPPLTSSINADSSWNTAGVAMFTAIRVGLHCPGYARDFGRIKVNNPIIPKISEQIRTWICCNIVSQSVATMFGFPSFTSFDSTVLSACRQDSAIDIPATMRHMMYIQNLENEIEQSLNSNCMDPLGLVDLAERSSLMQILSRKIDELEMNIGSELDFLGRFALLAARIHLTTYYFLDNDELGILKLQKGYVQAYNSALALLDHCVQVNKVNRDFMRFLPVVYVQVLWQSTAIVNKIYHSPVAEFIDQQAGRNLYFQAIQLMSKASIFKHDMAYRAAEISGQIWQVFDTIPAQKRATQYNEMLKSSIRTRRAASVFFDSLWIMREECGIRSVAPTVLKQRVHNSDDDEDTENGYTTEMFPQSQQPLALLKAAELVSAEDQLADEPEVSPSVEHTPAANNPSNFSWDVDLVFKDVDHMMTDFGFQMDEIPPL